MRVASAGFNRTVTRSHQLATRVDVLFDRVIIAASIPTLDATITYDRKAACLARLNITITDPTRVPVSATDVLTPFGYEIQVWRGMYVSGVPELVSLGVFPIQVSNFDTLTTRTTLTCEDRSRLVSDARFEDDIQIAAGTNYVTAIRDLIQAGVSGLTYNFPETTYTTPLLTFAAQEDRWEKAQQMAASIGLWLFFNGEGVCTMRSTPTFTLVPDLVIAEAENLVGLTVGLDRGTAYNKVVAASKNAATAAQYRGEAFDNDSQSPTYYYGPFGKKPRFFFSEFLSSNAQCDSAAASILADSRGVAQSMDFSAVPDPRLEVGDLIHVTRTGVVDDLHILDSLSISLGPENPMSGAARTQQAVVA